MPFLMPSGRRLASTCHASARPDLTPVRFRGRELTPKLTSTRSSAIMLIMLRIIPNARVLIGADRDPGAPILSKYLQHLRFKSRGSYFGAGPHFRHQTPWLGDDRDGIARQRASVRTEPKETDHE